MEVMGTGMVNLGLDPSSALLGVLDKACGESKVRGSAPLAFCFTQAPFILKLTAPSSAEQPPSWKLLLVASHKMCSCCSLSWNALEGVHGTFSHVILFLICPTLQPYTVLSIVSLFFFNALVMREALRHLCSSVSVLLHAGERSSYKLGGFVGSCVFGVPLSSGCPVCRFLSDPEGLLLRSWLAPPLRSCHLAGGMATFCGDIGQVGTFWTWVLLRLRHFVDVTTKFSGPWCLTLLCFCCCRRERRVCLR